MSRVRIRGGDRRRMLDHVSYTAVQFSFQMCLECGDGCGIFVTGDMEFQTAGAMMLNALDWKLILAADWYCSSGLEDLRVRVGSTWLMIMKQVT